MTWFFIALIGPLLWAIVNHIDKLLLEKYFKKGGVGTLLIFSSVIGLFLLPILFFLNPAILEVSFLNLILLLINGILAAIALWLYFIALADEEASIVVIFYQLIPVFGFILGYFLLGEVLGTRQICAMLIIIFGAMIISVEINEENKFKLRKKTVLLMILASLVYSIESVLFKFVAIKETLWISLFWEYVGLSVFGILLFIFFSKYRNDFLTMVKGNSVGIFSINILNEILYVIGNLLFAYSFLLAPVALVLLVNSYQPLCVLIIGVILTIFFPKLTVENIKIKHLAQKIIAIIVVGIGTYMLFLY